MENSELFEISYDGPALVSHEMEIRDLAPALLGLSAALEEANRIVNGQESKLSVKLKAGVKEGSVRAEIVCQLANAQWWDAAKTLSLSDDGKALQYLLGVLGVGCSGHEKMS